MARQGGDVVVEEELVTDEREVCRWTGAEREGVYIYIILCFRCQCKLP